MWWNNGWMLFCSNDLHLLNLKRNISSSVMRSVSLPHRCQGIAMREQECFYRTASEPEPPESGAIGRWDSSIMLRGRGMALQSRTHPIERQYRVTDWGPLASPANRSELLRQRSNERRAAFHNVHCSDAWGFSGAATYLSSYRSFVRSWSNFLSGRTPSTWSIFPISWPEKVHKTRH